MIICGVKKQIRFRNIVTFNKLIGSAYLNENKNEYLTKIASNGCQYTIPTCSYDSGFKYDVNNPNNYCFETAYDIGPCIWHQ